MTHNEKRQSSVREAQIALFTGSIYGAIHTVTGHPLDTIKSNMQVNNACKGLGATSVAKIIYREHGIPGFFRGCWPPLVGSALYRGVMMSAYEFTFSLIDLNTPPDHFLKEKYFGFLRPMVPVAVTFCSLIRGIVESPFEYAKIMGQTSQKWEYGKIFRGLHWQMSRTTALLVPIFVALDYFRTETNILKTLWGNFMVTFGVVGMSYIACWPLETIKNLAQSGTPHPNATLAEKIRYLGGPMGLMRGVTPGAFGGGMRNAIGMVTMVQAQAWATMLGMRD